jgi:hypothetical protein
MSVIKLTRPMKYRVESTPEIEQRARKWLATPLPEDRESFQRLICDLGTIVAGAASQSCRHRKLSLGRPDRHHHVSMAFAA